MTSAVSFGASQPRCICQVNSGSTVLSPAFSVGGGGGVILVSVFRFSDTAFEMLSSRCRPALMRKRANPVHW